MIKGVGFPKRVKLKRGAAALMAAVSALGVVPSGFAQTTASWISLNVGSWGDATKWSTNPIYPNGNFDVFFSLAGGYTVNLNTPVSLNTLTLNSPGVRLNQESGSLMVQNGIHLNGGTFNLGTATIKDTTISGSGGRFQLTGSSKGTLDHVTLATDLVSDIPGFSTQTVTVTNGLALNGGRILLQTGTSINNRITFVGTQAVSGTGEFVLGDRNVAQGQFFPYELAVAGGTTTIGQGISIRASKYIWKVGTDRGGGFLVNEGVISADPNTSLTMDGYWTNLGTIQSNGGGIALGGTFTTAGLGYITKGTGSVRIVGRLENGGQVFTLNDGTGAWVVGENGNAGRGSIIGGSIQTSGAATLDVNTGMFDGVTLDTNLPARDLVVNNSLTVAAGRRLDVSQTLAFGTNGMLSGSGSVVLNTTRVLGSATIGTGATVQSNGATAWGSATSTLVNRGLLWLNAGSLLIDGTWTNQGVFRLSSGTMSLGGVFGRADVGTVERLGGSLRMTGQIPNAGTEFRFDSSIGSVELDGARIDGGSLSIESGVPVTVRELTLGNVALASPLVVSGHLGIQDDGISPPTSGEIRLAGGSLTGQSTLVIPAGLTVRGFSGSSTVGLDQSSSGLFDNQGLLQVDAPGRLTIVGKWRNSGSILVDGGTLNLQGELNAASFGTLIRNGGTVDLTGSILNVGKQIALDSTTGAFFLTGSIFDGSLSTVDGTSLSVRQSSQMSNVTVAGHLVAVGSGTTGPARLGVTLSNASVTIQNTGTSMLDVRMDTGLKGTGTVVIDGTSSNNRFYGTTFVIDPGIHLRTGSEGGMLGVASPSFAMVNHGRISLVTPGKQLITAGTWSSDGTIDIADGTLVLGGTIGLGGTINRTGGVVDLVGYLNNNGKTLALDSSLGSILFGGGARIAGGSVTSSSTDAIRVLTGAASFEGTTLGADISVVGGTTLTLHNSLMTGSGHLIRLLGPGAPRLTTSGTTDLAGLSQITFDGTSLGALVSKSDTGTLTLPSSLTLYNANGGGGTTGSSGRVTVNYGTVSAESAGLPMTLTGSSVMNNGLLRAGNGGTLIVQNLVGNAGSLVVGSGGVMQLGGNYTLNLPVQVSGQSTLILGGTWNNASTISLDNSTLQISGPASAVGSVSMSGASLLINSTITSAAIKAMSLSNSTITVGTGGTVNSTGDFLMLDPAVAAWRLAGGSFSSGSLNTVGGASLLVSSVGTSTISGTALNAPVTVQDAGTILRLLGSWSNNQAISVSNATLLLDGTPANVGSIQMTGSDLVMRSSLTTAQLLSVQRSNTDVLLETGTLNNAGAALLIDGSLGQWTLGGTTISGGSIVSSNGGVLASAATGSILSAAIQAPIDVQSAGRLNLAGTWQNLNTITVNGGSVTLRGTFTQAELGTVVVTTGMVILGGTLNNAAQTLDLAARGWPLHLISGRIVGGRVQGSGSNALQLSSTNSGTLDGVVLAAPTTLSGGLARLNITNGLTLDLATIGTNSSITFRGTQSLDGNGTIVFNGSGGPLHVTSGELTIGSGIRMRTSATSSSGEIGLSGGTLINHGEISARHVSSTMSFGGTITNLGLVEARGGGTSRFTNTGVVLTNLSSNVLTDGRWAVYAGSTIAMNTTITTNNANILLDGVGSTFAPINPLHTNLGTFAIDHGRNFTTVGSLTNSGLLGIGTSSVMRVAGALNNTGSIDLVGTLIVDYTPGPGESAVFDELSSQIGTGIVSSLQDAAHAIGSADNALLQYTTFAGQAVDSSTVLMVLTYSGDANLDGVTDLDDYAMFLGGFGPAEGSALWAFGDFDYNGVVNLADFEFYLHGYYALGGSPSAIAAAVNASPVSESDKQAMLTMVATVPEPLSLGMIGLLIPWSLKRPRRRV